MTRSHLCLLTFPLLMALPSAPGLAAPPVLLRDINQYLRREDVDTRFFDAAAAGGKLYLRLDRPETGPELGVVDGTASTFELIDIEPGEFGSLPSQLTPFGTQILFSAIANDHGSELWISDGSPGGTVELKDIYLGSSGSNPGDFELLDDGTAVFSASDNTSGRELWRTNGTPGGTNRLFDLVTGPTGASPSEMYFLQPGVLIFQAFDPVVGGEPWIAALGGFGVLKDIVANGSSSPREFKHMPTPLRVLFSAAGPEGREPWVTDITEEGTTLLKNIETGTGSSVPFDFRLVGDVMVFNARSSADGREWWRSEV